MSKLMPIDFQSDTFAYILEDMTADMNTLLRNMDSMGSSDGKFALTINVHLENSEHEGEDCTVPEFKHKIKVGFNVSHQTDGQMDGEYALKKNPDGNFSLVLIGEQMSMYDEDEEDDEDEEEYNDDMEPEDD